MAFVVGVVSRKGGQGKSTLSVSLAAVSCSAKRPKTFQSWNGTILVDADSQGSASRWGLSPETFATLGAVSTVAALEFPSRSPGGSVTREQHLERALSKCLFPVSGVDGLSIVPSCPSVHPENAKEILLSSLPADIVVVDTGADTSTNLVRSVIQQADYLVVPTVCELWGVDALDMVFEEVRSCGRSDLFEGGLSVVISKREKNKVHDVLEAKIREGLGDVVSSVVVPKSATISHVAGGPQYLTARHALRTLVSDLWVEIISKTQTRRVAA